MVPIGVIEVKKTDCEEKECGESILDESTVLGELYDFVLKLPNFYGVRPAFGVLTTFETWRMCWIPDSDAEVDRMARTTESLPNLQYQFSTPTKISSMKQRFPGGITPSKTKPILHTIEKDAGGDNSADKNEDQIDADPRVLHGSRIYSRMDEKHLATRAIAATLCKMTQVKQMPFGSPFVKMNERMLLRFTKGSSRSIHWCRMGKVVPHWNKFANPTKYLFAIEDLGKGSDGRVWLTCSSSGAICVLKFPIKKTKSQSEDVAQELQNWHIAYPEFETKVFHEQWCGRDA